MSEQVDRKLQEQMLLARRVEGDSLRLADEVLEAALAGTRHLTAGERSALQASPLTLRRLRTLSQRRRLAWQGSRGMLRAASGTAPLDTVSTDDGCWTLHFAAQGQAWRVILALDPGAAFAPQLLHRPSPLRVIDGAGNVVLQASLDADGECEADWPFADAPAAHFQAHGASFAVQPVR